MVTERDEVEAARSGAERMMELERPLAYTTVRTLLSGLSHANSELVRLRSDRDRWQDAYCEPRLQAHRDSWARRPTSNGQPLPRSRRYRT